MPDPASVAAPVPLDQPAVHVNVEPGGEIVLRGSYHSKHDGSIVDAATTTWPPEAPGGGRVSSNDVYADDRGLVYLIDRMRGLSIVERV